MLPFFFAFLFFQVPESAVMLSGRLRRRLSCSSRYRSLRRLEMPCVMYSIPVAYVSIRQHTSAFVSTGQHALLEMPCVMYCIPKRESLSVVSAVKRSTSSGSTWHMQHPSASVSIRQHPSAYVSIAYVSAEKRSPPTSSTWYIRAHLIAAAREVQVE